MIRTLEKPVAGLSKVLMLVASLLMVLAPEAPGALAQEKATGFDPYPLRPPDTSSPRDTLRSFLTNTNAFIEDWRRNPSALGTESYRAYTRAIETLDLSTTTDQNSRMVRTLRVLFLKEILDRIEVPPNTEIPGDGEVADGSITQWTIPNTRITIAKIEEGPHAGEFLFSANTVQQLDRLYRHARHLPYKPGASIGIYEDFIRSDRTPAALERKLRNRLKPVDTSNPRSTLEGFLDSVNRAFALVTETNEALKSTPPTVTKDEAREVEILAANLLARAIVTLDLSQVPKALRQDIGVESVLMLKEILDRALLPQMGTIPNAEMVAAARKEGSRLFLRTGGPLRWRYPNSEIEIVEITEGERQGQFLFSASTVNRLSNFYKEIRDLPYRRTDFGSLVFDYLSPDLSPGFYEFYISTPGYLIPHAHFLGELLDVLPSGFEKLHGGQTLWQWIGLLFCVLVTALAAYAVFHFIKRLARRLREPTNEWLIVLAPVIVAIIVFAVGDFIDKGLNITGKLLNYLAAGSEAIVLAMTAWAVLLFFKAIAETIIRSPRIHEESIDASLWRISARVVGFLIGAWIIIDGIRGLGADVVPLLAGLGVGGLAVALAAQSTVANFIGSLILFANRPVRVGDFCRYGDQIGTVEEIGLHSTRIRTLERTIVTVPNAEFSQMKLESFAVRDRRLFRTTLQLRYETTPEQMRYILAKLRELLLGHPMVTSDPARVRLIGYGPYSKDVEIFSYLNCQEQNDFLAIQEDLLLRIEDIIVAAGSGFAFPSQTAYFSRDTGVDTERGIKAETQVESWRATGKLPFPEFEKDERERLEDSLDYPPKGSPYYKPREGLSDK